MGVRPSAAAGAWGSILVSARGPVIILFYRMGFGGQFRSTEYLFLMIWRFLRSFFWFGFGGRRLCEPGRPGCNRARAESVPAKSPTENRKTLKMRGGLACQESFDRSARSPADRNIGRFGTSRRHPRRQLRRRQPRRKATSKKATSKERASDIMFLFAIAVFQLGWGGLKIGRLLTLNTRP